MTDMAELLFLGSCAVSDLRTRKVPNRLLAGWFLCWLLLFLPLSGHAPPEMLWFVIRTGAAAILLFPVFRFRMAGAGDVKTAAMLAGMLGPAAAARTLLYGLTAAAGWSLYILLRRGLAGQRLMRLAGYLKELEEYAAGKSTVKRGKSGEKRTPPPYRREEDGEAEICLIPFFFLGMLAEKRLWIAELCGKVLRG